MANSLRIKRNSVVGEAPTALDNGELAVNTADAKLWVGDPSKTPVEITTDISGKADIDSPLFTGNPKAPTPGSPSNDDTIATTRFVRNRTNIAMLKKLYETNADTNAFTDTEKTDLARLASMTPAQIKGDKGDTGTAGADGADGTAGVDGADGAKGDQGDKGDPGDDGTDGAAGTVGVTGSKGDKGAKGDKGDAGADGTDGAQGAAGTGINPKGSATKAQIIAVTSPAIGDAYKAATAGDYVGLTGIVLGDLLRVDSISPTVWVNIGPLQGPAGARGPKGVQGLKGDDGSAANVAAVTGLQSALDLKANIASPTFTGSPKAPTAANATNDGTIATTKFVRNRTAPGLLKNLYESNANTNAFTDGNKAKLSALATLTPAQILTKLKTVDGASSGLDAGLIGGVARSQLARTDIVESFTKAVTFKENILPEKLVDGRDIAADGTKLDAILDWTVDQGGTDIDEGNYDIEVERDITPTLGGALNCNGQTLNGSSYRQADDAVLADGDVHTVDFSEGDSQTVTAPDSGAISVVFAGFVTGQTSTYILQVVNWGGVVVTWPAGTQFDDRKLPLFTRVGLDHLLITKDKNDVYSVGVMFRDLGVI